MTPARTAALVALLALAACGDSGLNPFRWFGGGSQDNVRLYPEGGFAERVDFRDLVAEVTRLEAESAPGGVILHATGLPPRQGYWDGELTSDTGFIPEDGVLTLMFRIRPPLTPTDVNTPRSREVEVGLFLSRQKLAGVREIRVTGQSNTRSLRR